MSSVARTKTEITVWHENEWGAPLTLAQVEAFCAQARRNGFMPTDKVMRSKEFSLTYLYMHRASERTTNY